jgi:hypothetical protein
MVSPIDHVVMNHQNQTRTNDIWGYVRYTLLTRIINPILKPQQQIVITKVPTGVAELLVPKHLVLL